MSTSGNEGHQSERVNEIQPYGLPEEPRSNFRPSHINEQPINTSTGNNSAQADLRLDIIKKQTELGKQIAALMETFRALSGTSTNFNNTDSLDTISEVASPQQNGGFNDVLFTQPTASNLNNSSAGFDRSFFLSTAPKRPSFSGDDTINPMEFLNDLQNYGNHLQLTDHQMLTLAMDCLKTHARNCMQIFQKGWRQYSDFRKDFLKVYWSEVQQNEIKIKISVAKWDPKIHKKMLDHFSFILGQANLLTNPLPENLLMSMLIQHFSANIQALWEMNFNKTIQGMAEFLNTQDHIWKNEIGPVRQEKTHIVPRNNPYTKDNRKQTGNEKKLE